MTTSLSPRLLERLDAYWRAANYLKFGQLYLTRLFRRFSLPGGIPNHAAAETPGSINEGGELEYSLPHEYGADFDNPT